MKRERINDEVRGLSRFKKGEKRPENAGRKKGSKNKVSSLLKDALIMAAELEGSDRRGKDELVGFLRMAARKNLDGYMRLLAKLLPYQLTGKDGGPMQVEHKTREQLVERLKERGLTVPASLMDGPAVSQSVN